MKPFATLFHALLLTALALSVLSRAEAQAESGNAQLAETLRDLRPMAPVLRRQLQRPSLAAIEDQNLRTAFEGTSLQDDREGWTFPSAEELYNLMGRPVGRGATEDEEARFLRLAEAFLDETRLRARSAGRRALRACETARRLGENDSEGDWTEASEYFHLFATERPYALDRKQMMRLAPFELAVALAWSEVSPRFASERGSGDGAVAYRHCVDQHRAQEERVRSLALSRACEAYGFDALCSASDLRTQTTRTLARDASQWSEVRERFRSRIATNATAIRIPAQVRSPELFDPTEIAAAYDEWASQMRRHRRFPSEAPAVGDYLLALQQSDLESHPSLRVDAQNAWRSLVLWCRNEVRSCHDSLFENFTPSGWNYDEEQPLHYLLLDLPSVLSFDRGGADQRNASETWHLINEEDERQARENASRMNTGHDN